jgi:hypothetical protein
MTHIITKENSLSAGPQGKKEITTKDGFFCYECMTLNVHKGYSQNKYG